METRSPNHENSSACLGFELRNFFVMSWFEQKLLLFPFSFEDTVERADILEKYWLVRAKMPCSVNDVSEQRMPISYSIFAFNNRPWPHILWVTLRSCVLTNWEKIKVRMSFMCGGGRTTPNMAAQTLEIYKRSGSSYVSLLFLRLCYLAFEVAYTLHTNE